MASSVLSFQLSNMIFLLMDIDILMKDLRCFGVGRVNMPLSNTMMGCVECLVCP